MCIRTRARNIIKSIVWGLEASSVPANAADRKAMNEGKARGGFARKKLLHWFVCLAASLLCFDVEQARGLMKGSHGHVALEGPSKRGYAPSVRAPWKKIKHNVIVPLRPWPEQY